MSRLIVLTLIVLLTTLTLWSSAPLVRAQPAASDTLIDYGQVVTGQIDNDTPRTVYTFEALRCDFVSLRLTATSGNLDPMLVVLDETGAPVLTQDDNQSTLDVSVETLMLPRSGRYSLVVSRFGHALGTTTGSYELFIERIGNGSASGCAMRYGDTVYNYISNMEPEMFYSFRARQGDVVNVYMERRSGDLDAYLRIVDSTNVVITYNDDAPGAGTDAAIMGLFIPRDGTYYIAASRYGLAAGTSTGNFILTLEEAAGSGQGSSPTTALFMRQNNTQEGDITPEQPLRYYRFEGQQNDIISISLERLTGDLDSLVVLADSRLRELAQDDDSGGSQNALIDGYLLPADGTYYIIATRYDREQGRTSGRYRLRLSSQGSAFDGVPSDVRRLNYRPGMSITGTIDDVTPQIDYAFWGVEGDTITVSMNRGDGDLDPVLFIFDATRSQTLATDDDSGGGQNARIDRFEIPETGIYYVRATRYPGADNPNTGGSFTLAIAQIFDQP
ncbi:MAG: PPC domain-containing protein [Phototrophicaceae bacterium]